MIKIAAPKNEAERIAILMKTPEQVRKGGKK